MTLIKPNEVVLNKSEMVRRWLWENYGPDLTLLEAMQRVKIPPCVKWCKSQGFEMQWTVIWQVMKEYYTVWDRLRSGSMRIGAGVRGIAPRWVQELPHKTTYEAILSQRAHGGTRPASSTTGSSTTTSTATQEEPAAATPCTTGSLPTLIETMRELRNLAGKVGGLPSLKGLMDLLGEGR